VSSGGVKKDAGKPQWSLLPFDAVREVVHVLGVGAKKYAPRNWENGVAWSRYYDASMRHLTSWWMGEKDDPEDGLPHLAHAACCVLFLLAYELRGMGCDWDDRPGRVHETLDYALQPGLQKDNE
jgi:hypothetical protein